jgi:hypothetical protein
MSKFSGKFRKNDDYADDYDRSNQKLNVKRKVKEHSEIKKKLKEWEYKNRYDDEEDRYY